MGSHFRCNCPVLKIRPEMSIYSISIHSVEEEGFNVPIQMLPQLELSSVYIYVVIEVVDRRKVSL